MEMWPDHTSKEIGEVIGRSDKGVYAYAKYLGLKKTHKWTEQDCETLRRLHPNFMKAALEIGAPLASVYTNAIKLGLRVREPRTKKGKK